MLRENRKRSPFYRLLEDNVAHNLHKKDIAAVDESL